MDRLLNISMLTMFWFVIYPIELALETAYRLQYHIPGSATLHVDKFFALYVKESLCSKISCFIPIKKTSVDLGYIGN